MNETHNAAVILRRSRRISLLGFFTARFLREYFSGRTGSSSPKMCASLRMTILVLIFFCITTNLHAAYESYHPKYEKDNSFEVLSRGILNAATLPVEAQSTLLREKKAHPRLWPLTYGPRLFHNTWTRVASFAIDLSILPIAAPFADDTSPRTEGMGLPKYPWQIE